MSFISYYIDKGFKHEYLLSLSPLEKQFYIDSMTLKHEEKLMMFKMLMKIIRGA